LDCVNLCKRVRIVLSRSGLPGLVCLECL
jgi:hypothetical protein